jgi:AcrR family transcriptional regulator
MSEIIKKKEDNRIRYTKMRIRSAFYELLQELGYEKVTVTAICKKAEINRATFYKHYLDVPDLVDKLQESAIEKLSEKLDAADYNSMEEFVADILRNIRETKTDNSAFNDLIFKSGSLFSRKISVLLYNRFSDAFVKYADESTGLKKDVMFAYISAGSAGIIDYWSQTGFRENEETIASYILKLSNSTLTGLKQH